MSTAFELIRPRAPASARIVAKKIEVIDSRTVTQTPSRMMTGPDVTTNSQSQASAAISTRMTPTMIASQTAKNVSRHRVVLARRAAAISPTIGAT